MKIVIQAVPTRIQNTERLVSLLPPDTLVYTDTEQDATAAFIETLRLADSDDLLHLEDDIVLTSDFVNKVKKAVEESSGDCIINLFSLDVRDHFLRCRHKDPDTFISTCAIYIPQRIVQELLLFSETWSDHPDYHLDFDMMIRAYLIDTKQQYGVYVPSLVQHMAVESVIDPTRSIHRQSPTWRP